MKSKESIFLFYSKVLDSLRRELSFTRRTARFFLQIQFIYSSFKMIKAFRQAKKEKHNPRGSLFYVVVSTLSNLLGVSFLSLDAIFWGYMAKITTNRELASKILEANSYIWIASSIVMIVLALFELQSNQYLARDIKAGKFRDLDHVKREIKFKKIENDLHMNPLKIIKYVCDLMVIL